MKFDRFFKDEWKDRFIAMKNDKAVLYSGKCLLDRMPLRHGEYQPNSIDQQQSPKKQEVATHQIMCKSSFDINSVSFFVIRGEKWIYNDFNLLGNCYLIDLHSLGEYVEEA